MQLEDTFKNVLTDQNLLLIAVVTMIPSLKRNGKMQFFLALTNWITDTHIINSIAFIIKLIIRQ